MPGINLSIFKKGVILIALPMLFQLGMLAYLLRVQHDVADAEQWEIHTKQVIENANQIVLTLTEAHTRHAGHGLFS